MPELRDSRRAWIAPLVIAGFLAAIPMIESPALSGAERSVPPSASVSLPAPHRQGGQSLAAALAERRSVRAFKPTSITLAQVADLLWAAQGINGSLGRRTVPSAGGFYPIEIYLASVRVIGLPQGLYRYRPQKHDLLRLRGGAVIEELQQAANGQPWVANGAAALVITGNVAKTAKKYGHPLADQFVLTEVGHAAQNVYLQANALALGTVEVGGVEPDKASKVLGSPQSETVFAILPVGAPAE